VSPEWMLFSGVIGLLHGLLFVYVMKLTNRKGSRAIQLLKAELIQDETLIVEGPANHIKKAEGVGKLFLTNSRLIFASPKQNNQVCYPLDMIIGIKLYKIGGVFNKGLMINVEGRVEKFIVDYPKDWLELIKTQRNMC